MMWIILAMALGLVFLLLQYRKLQSENNYLKIRLKTNTTNIVEKPEIDDAKLIVSEVIDDGVKGSRDNLYYSKISVSMIEIIFNSVLATSKTISFFAVDTSYNYIVYNQNHRDLMNSLGIEIEPGGTGLLTYLDKASYNDNFANVFKLNAERALAGENFIFDEAVNIEGMPTIYQKVEYTPLTTRTNEVIGIAVIIRDMTTEYIHKQKLEQATLEEKNSNQAKSNFLANMSHEIRTPMNGILGLTDLLLETKLDEQQHYFLTMIRKSGLSLLSIINDILDFSKIESGNYSILESDVNLYQLIDEIKEFFHFKSDTMNIQFITTIDPNVPVWIKLDSLRIRQILINLIGNAFKFTKEGYVKLIVRIIKKNDDTEYLKISVEDTGMGIPFEKLSSVFDRFKQAENDYSRSHDGTGLGLSICKQLISAMDGSIDVISKKNIGSIFYFEIPLKRGDKRYSDDSTKQLKIHFSKEIKILIVEDNKVNGLLAQAIMEKIGVTSSIARNGLEAVRMVEENTYDLVFMDISMPVMDGLEAFKIIREELKKTLPIVALTAHSMTEDRQRILSVGMTDYLSKPFTESDVCHIIEKYVINPAKIVQGISDIQTGQLGENKYGFDSQSAPIPKFVLDTPIDQLVDREKKELEISSVNPYNEVAYVNKHSNAHRLALFNEAYDGIEHVFKMLDNDYETTVELVGKLIELLREPVFEDLRVRIINNDRTGVQEIIHNLKGAVSNFRLTHMMDEFVKIKNSDWSSMEQIDEILGTIRELTEIIQAAFEQFKLKN